MKCQILFSGKKKKNILKCRLLQILPRVLSVNLYSDLEFHFFVPHAFLTASVTGSASLSGAMYRHFLATNSVSSIMSC